MSKTIVKVKVYSDSFDGVLSVLDKVRNCYAPNATQSDVKPSKPSGFHAFLTVYLEAA